MPNVSRSGNFVALWGFLSNNFPIRKFFSKMASIRTPQQLGHAVRTARKHIGLTQPQLAMAAGVGVRFLVELEAGKPTLRLEQILRVVDALGGEVELNGLPSADQQCSS